MTEWIKATLGFSYTVLQANLDISRNKGISLWSFVPCSWTTDFLLLTMAPWLLPIL